MNPLRGILFKVASIMGFLAMSTCIKIIADHIPTGEVVFFRSAFALPVIFVWLWLQHDFAAGLKTKNPLGHLWRGLIGTTAMGLNFTALGLLPLPEVTAIGYATPLLVTVFAAMFLGETIRAYRLGAVGLGLIGVLIVLGPRFSVITTADGPNQAETLGAMAMLLSAVFIALATVFVRKLVQTEKTTAVVFYFTITSTVMSLFTLPFGWVLPEPDMLVWLICAGLFGGLAQIFMTTSYRHADAGVIAPFEYTSLLFSLAIGWFVFAELPTIPMLIGAALVIAAGLLIIWRERQLGIERRRARQSMTP